MIYNGVDLIEIERVAQSAQKWGDRFLAHIYTADELAYCRGRAAELAVRFAAKEAASKALGTGLVGLSGGNGVSWHEIEVVREPDGRPSLRLHGAAAARAQQLRWTSVSLSLSHSRDYAIAFVSAQSEP